jgi:hypothetical protein
MADNKEKISYGFADNFGFTSPFGEDSIFSQQSREKEATHETPKKDTPRVGKEIESFERKDITYLFNLYGVTQSDFDDVREEIRHFAERYNLSYEMLDVKTKEGKVRKEYYKCFRTPVIILDKIRASQGQQLLYHDSSKTVEIKLKEVLSTRLLDGINILPTKSRINLIATKVDYRNPDIDSLNSVKKIEDYILLMEQVEYNFYTAKERVDLKYMATQFRKMYYDDKVAWDNIIAGPKNEEGKVKKRDEEASKVYNYKVKHDIRKVKIVTTSDGIRHNIQHVFAGIDAVNYAVPKFEVGQWVLKVLPIFKTFETNNFDAATWAGDLGTMGAYFLYCLETEGHYLQNLIQLSQEADAFKLNYESQANLWVQQKWQELADKEACPEDLIGDVDGIVLGNILNRYNVYANLTLSQVLKSYYNNENGFYDNRINLFLRGTKINHRSQKLKYSQEISDCAMMGFLRYNMSSFEKTAENYISAKLENYRLDTYLGLGSSSLWLKHFLKALENAPAEIKKLKNATK